VKLAVSVTVTMTGEDGSQCPVSGELAAALAAPVVQFSQMLTWAAGDAGAADHGDRETEIAKSGRELQRQLLEATFTIDAGCEDRVEQVTSAAGIRHGTVEKGHDRGVVSIFGPVRADPDGVPEPAGGEPVPGRCPVDAARGPVLAGDARAGGVSPG
jgi:hypothetical protein